MKLQRLAIAVTFLLGLGHFAHADEASDKIAKLAKSAAKFNKECALLKDGGKIQDISIVNKTAESFDKTKLSASLVETLKLQTSPDSKLTMEVVVKSVSTEDAQKRATAYTLKVSLAQDGTNKCFEAYPAVVVENK